MADIVITVHGTPVPQGSKVIVTPKGQRPRLLDHNKDALDAWRELVAKAARETGCAMLRRPVAVDARVLVPRPASHYRRGEHTGHLLTSAAPPLPKGPPDIDKYARALLDALAMGGIYDNDGQVCDLHAVKRYARYGQPPGAVITIREIWEQEP